MTNSEKFVKHQCLPGTELFIKFVTIQSLSEYG